MAVFGLPDTSSLDPRDLGRRLWARMNGSADSSTMPPPDPSPVTDNAPAPDPKSDAAPTTPTATAPPTSDPNAPVLRRKTPEEQTAYSADPGQTAPQDASGAGQTAGPAMQRLGQWQSQHPMPEQQPLHGWKKGLDMVGQVLAPNIEDTIRNYGMHEYQREEKPYIDAATSELGQQKDVGEIGHVAAQTDQSRAAASKDRAETDRQKRMGTSKPIIIQDEHGNPVPANQNIDSSSPNFGQVTDATSQPVTNAKMWEKPVAAAKPTELEEDQRYETIATNRRLRKPISPEDDAWSKSYEQRKTLTTDKGDANKDADTQVYSEDDNGRVILTTKADAAKRGKVWELVPPGGVKQDRDALSLMGNVQMNATNYKKAVMAINHNISGDHAVSMANILSDPKLDESTLARLVGLGNVTPIMTQLGRAKEWTNLLPEEREAVTQYLRAKGSVIAYQRALTNQGRTNPEALRVEFDTIPEPYVGASVAGPRFDSFQQNIDQVQRKFPTNLPGMQVQPQQSQQPSGNTKPAKWNGKQWIDAATGQPIPTR